MNASYKRIHYRAHTKDFPAYPVCYVRYPGDKIVFTGLDVNAPSSINCAESIIYAIAGKENINPQDCTFFDLQTMQSYADHKPGDYCFDKLIPTWKDGKIIRMDWHAGHCADVILEDFAGYIQGSNGLVTFRNLAEVYGSIKPLPDTGSLNTIADMLDLAILVNDVCERHHIDKIQTMFMERLITAASNLCCEQGLDPCDGDRFHDLPRDTRLGPSSSLVFNDICDWLKKQHAEFNDSISPILFIG